MNLSQMKPGYDGNPKRVEITGFSPGIVEGCGYAVYEMTLEEAEELANTLLTTVSKVKAEFSNEIK